MVEERTAVCETEFPRDQNWYDMSFAEAFLLNPRVPLELGSSVPFVGMASVVPGLRSVCASDMREFRGHGSRFEHGDTLMARITPCLENGKIARYCAADGLGTAHGSTEFIVVRGRPKVSDTAFAFYMARSGLVREYAIGQMTGTSGRQRVPVQSLLHLPIPVPPLAQQRSIARILGAFDDRIELNLHMNEDLEAMARALFKSWFVDFDPVRAKMEGRDPVLPPEIVDLFPDRLVESEVGEIPEGWEVSEIGKEVDAVGGATPSTNEPTYWSGGRHHWVTPRDLSKLISPVLLETDRRITDAGVEKISSGLLPVGTVLLSSRAPIGYLAVAAVPTAINQGFIAMICRKRLSDLYVLFWCYENLDHIKGISGGSTFAEISKRVFRPIPVVVPPKRVLEAYEGVSRSLYDQIVSNTRKRALLSALRDTLLPRLVSGAVRLPATLVGRYEEAAT